MERDVRRFMHRPVEMGRRHKPAEIVIALFVLRKEGQPVDDGRLAVRPASRTRDCQQTADAGLHAGTHLRFRNGPGAVTEIGSASGWESAGSIVKISEVP